MTSNGELSRGRSGLRWLTGASFAFLVLGFIVLLAYSVAEALANPGISLVDAYWRGRLPWMGIAEALIVSGATASAVIGAATVFGFGGSWRRILTIPPLLPIGLWWLLAVSGFPGGHPCLPSPCPPQPIDPRAFAYSGPTQALLLLILPSAFIALLALIARRQEAPGPRTLVEAGEPAWDETEDADAAHHLTR